jgi:PAS domain S-box-containing protein
MQTDPAMELTEVERIARQLRLLNEVQAENLVGCWEQIAGEDHVLWSASMFTLHEIPPAPDNLITPEVANSLIHPDDLGMVLRKREELAQSGYVEFNFRILAPENKIKYIHARERKLVEEELVIYRGNWQDRAREREFQQPVMDANEQLSIRLKIFERAEEVGQSGSWQINLETFETFYSDNVYRIYGVEPQSIPPHVDTFRKFIHPEDRAIVLRTHEKAYVEMIPLSLEYRIIRQDGELRYISQASLLLKNNKGEHILAGTTRDITTEKLLDIQVQEANEVLTLHNELFIQSEQIGNLGTWQVNLNTRKSVYSANLFRIYGLKPFSIGTSLQNFIQYVHPDDREMLQSAYAKAFDEHIPPDLEFRINRTDGKTRILRQKTKYIKADGEELLIGIVQDITDQQQKDKLLKETVDKLALQNEAFRHAEKVAGMGSWTWNLDTNEMVYSDNVYTIYGLKPQSIPPGYDHFGKYMHPQDRKWMKSMPGKLRAAREAASFDYRIIRPDGELRYLRSRSAPVTNSEGHTIIVGITHDITAEVQMQEQLLERIHFAELLADTIIDRIIVTDTSNNIIGWNKTCEQFYKLPKQEVLGRNFFDVLPKLRTPQIMDRFKRALAGETIHVPVMAAPHMPGGSQEMFTVPVKTEQGKVIGILHLMHDTSRLQQLQDQLTQRLQFIEKLQEASIDRIIVLDRDLYFQLWNKECEKYYGLSKEQVVGRNILEVFPKFKTDPLYPHCLRALDGETVHVPANERAGLQGYQESYFVPLKNELKEVTAVLWIIHDLTERYIAEQRLRTSETHLRAAQEIAMVGSFEMEITGDLIEWSDQTYKIFDYPPGEEISPSKVDARIHPDDLAQVREAFAGLQSGATEVADTYFRIITTDQTLKHLYSRTLLIKDEKGQPLRIFGIVQDITGKKQVEEEILKQQELWRQAEEIAHIGTWELDTGTKKFVWSDEVFRIYGYAPQAFEPNLDFYLETIHPEDRVQLRIAITEAITLGKPYAITCRIFTLDGELRYIHTRGKPMDTVAGQKLKIIGTMQDSTAQKMLEAELRKRSQMVRTRYQMDRMTEKIRNIGSWQWDLKTGKLLWTEKMFELFGLRPFSIDVTIDSFLELMHPADRERLRQDLHDMQQMNEGTLPDYEFRVMVNGAWRFMRASSRRMREGFIVGLTIDITQDALLRQELSEKVRQLQEMNEELTSFAFVASHDLREPLRKIQIFSDWLLQKESEKLSKEGIDRFKRIQAAVVRMETLIDDILSFSRISTGEKHFTDVGLNSVLESVKGDLQETIAEKQAVIEAGDLPVVKGNQSQFMQLFQNVLSNALKYQKPGTPPHIRITSARMQGKQLAIPGINENTEYVKVSFADDGIGFDPQYSKKIFQMFQRLHGIHEFPGTGMGLAICKKILEYHGGFMTAAGEPGAGACFDCYIPVK